MPLAILAIAVGLGVLGLGAVALSRRHPAPMPPPMPPPDSGFNAPIRPDFASREGQPTAPQPELGAGDGLKIATTLISTGIGLTGATLSILKTAGVIGGATGAGVGGATGGTTGGATTAVVVGETAAASAGSSGGTAATAATGVAAGAAAGTAGLWGLAAVVAAIWLAFVLAVTIPNDEHLRLRAIVRGRARQRLHFGAFQEEEFFIRDAMQRVGETPGQTVEGAPAFRAPVVGGVKLSYTADGQAGDFATVDVDGKNVERFNIPILSGSPTWFVTELPCDGEATRVLVDLARWVALTKLEAENEYLRSFYFVTRYARFASARLPVSDQIQACNAAMTADGVALTETDFAEWRDGEYFPAHNRRPWPPTTSREADGFSALAGGTRIQARQFFGTQADTVFDPPLTWDECKRVAAARLPADANKLARQLRCIAHGSGLMWAHAYDAYFDNAQQKQTLVRLGYAERPSQQWPGESDYVDPQCGWYFTPRMVLRDENGAVIQRRSL